MMWHSLDENGKIEIYDVEWPDGTVETNIPAGLLEGVKIAEHGNTKKEGAHGVQDKATPVNERNYKGKMMRISKNQLRRIIKEEKQKLLSENRNGALVILGQLTDEMGVDPQKLLDYLVGNWMTGDDAFQAMKDFQEYEM